MLFKKKTISNIDLKDKRVLVRADYNVPMDGLEIADDYRIVQSIPTIKALLEQNASVVLMSHMGRPKGKVVPELSLKVVAERLSGLLGEEVLFEDDCISEQAAEKAKTLEPGQILLVENLRFHYEEEVNDVKFAEKLARLGEVLVQDGFGVVHREHASTAAVTKFLPSVAGLLLETEVREITRAIKHPKAPLVAIVGGAKIKTKIELLDNLMNIADRLIIGGAMANTFMVAMDMEIGKSLFDQAEVEVARQIIDQCQDKNIQLLLPLLDVAVATEVNDKAKRKIVASDEVGKNDIILDFGPKSIASVKQNLSDAGEVIWNGPFGMMEFAAFKVGSEEIAHYIVDHKIQSVVGGGDTVELIGELGMMDGFTHVSTGGGASLELMSGLPLPGLDNLLDK